MLAMTDGREPPVVLRQLLGVTRVNRIDEALLCTFSLGARRMVLKKEDST
jgi:hypothetical protein